MPAFSLKIGRERLNSLLSPQGEGRRRRFFRLWLLIAIFVLVALYRAGMAPVTVREAGDWLVAPLTRTHETSSKNARLTTAALKPRIIIPDAGINSPVVFPKSTDLEVLNSELAKGAVHYPGSALPGEDGNVFLFGHSSRLAVTKNKAFSAFNRLSELERGDVIRIRNGEREHWYRVVSVEMKKDDAAVVELRNSGPRTLVLSTCRVFGEKDDRFIVTAEFVKSYPLLSHASAADTSS